MFLTLFFLPFSLFSYRPFEDLSSRIFYFLNHKNSPSDKNIVLVAIDDYSLQKVNQKWPFARSLYAQAIDVIAKNKVKAAGFDLVLSGKSFNTADDLRLISSLKNFNQKVVFAYSINKGDSPNYPAKEFRDYSLTGLINVPSDPDGLIRRLRMAILIQGSSKTFSDFSWAAKTTGVFLGSAPRLLPGRVELGGRSIPVDDYGVFNVDYLVKPQDVLTISFYDLLTGNFPAGSLTGKIIVFAATSEMIHDIHNTPLGRMPGVFVHINAIADILESKFLRPLPIVFSLMIVLGVLFFIAFVLINLDILSAVALFLGVMLLILWLDVVLRFFGWLLPLDKIAVLSSGYLVLCGIYAYFEFITMMDKIKTKMVTDSVSGLYNPGYFIERTNLSLKSFVVYHKYLCFIDLVNFDELLKGVDIGKMKDFWKRIDEKLWEYSRLWAKNSNQQLFGILSNKDDILKVRAGLQSVFIELGLEVPLQTAAIRLSSGMDTRNVLSVLKENMGKTNESLIFLDNLDYLKLSRQPGEDSFAVSLFRDVEDSSRQLLEILEKLKAEEKKTKEAYFQLVLSLVGALESKDPYTNGHSQRVSQYSVLLADKLGLPLVEKEKIKVAALLHDLGKIGIPDGILHKKDKLTDDEFAVIKEHEVISAKILEPIKEFHEIIPYILHHHEKFDGTGYPHGLAGQMIPLGARIISVADVYDALITGRDYKMAFSPQSAFEELERVKGKQFDPQLVDVFVSALKENRMI